MTASAVDAARCFAIFREEQHEQEIGGCPVQNEAGVAACRQPGLELIQRVLGLLGQRGLGADEAADAFGGDQANGLERLEQGPCVTAEVGAREPGAHARDEVVDVGEGAALLALAPLGGGEQRGNREVTLPDGVAQRFDGEALLVREGAL